MFTKCFLITALAAIGASAHGVVTTPTPRGTGSTHKAACGAAVAKKLTDDLTGPIENSLAVVDSSTTDACNLLQCRGFTYADNKAKVQTYSVGDVVDFEIDLVAHHTGYANVSVIDLASNTAIERLFTWPVYADSTLGPSKWPKNDTEFSVTIPDVSSECATAGACAIQWFWYATENSQTYESCVDFVIG
ncbi:hypothetical protein CYLTODRAFT_421860 [Cylindrobasidium torrendii FP15055 ss-10]|uniref:Chitin-binding type-4 domain-containing protein n=1 Tax=Cylindrobasidium torrendii FP15055 ss-10 TaxID=1314674 RepID=A0A0D7BD99_9AGAR|nr:hypothetical protein CYLTODRAFT_421860 [Cylindrobasidium torrendii FP15055 ss-10]